jgi:hypothetical protein
MIEVESKYGIQFDCNSIWFAQQDAVCKHTYFWLQNLAAFITDYIYALLFTNAPKLTQNL